ncbi:hypothetical protein [Streptomyces sp. NPDC046805]|uniref:hypothetical protein n=1 Tax=Streptomyces sp. NPDC046805 TaxID=3155134 RepID=UPI0033EEB73D
MIALDAGPTRYTGHQYLAAVRAALGRCREVACILSSTRREMSLAVLRRRCMAGKGRSRITGGHGFPAPWLDGPGTRMAAAWTLCTSGEAPARAATQLLRLG